MGYFSSILAEPAAQQAGVSALADQLRAQSPGTNWNIQGIDRAQELAQWLASRGVSSAANPTLSWEDYTIPGSPAGYQYSGNAESGGSVWSEATPDTVSKRGYLDFGGVRLGNEGNIHSGNGQLGYIPDKGAKNVNQAFASSTEGHGAVSYQYVQGADGKLRIIPKWTSTSDMGAVRDVLKAGLVAVGGLGLAGFGPLGETLGGVLGGAADAGAGAAVAEVGGAGAAEAGITGGISATGGAGYGTIAGAPGVYGGAAGTFAPVLGQGGAALATGSGLTAPAFVAGAGEGLVGGLGMTAGAGAAASGGGISGLLSTIGGYLPAASQLASLASGVYGMKLAGDVREASDPFAPYRGAYAKQLADLEKNPGSIVTRPGFQAGLETIGRKSAASGYYGSGNMASALSRYSGDFYNQEATRLAGLAGAGQSPGAGQVAAADLASQSLGSIGYGLGPLLQRLTKGG